MKWPKKCAGHRLVNMDAVVCEGNFPHNIDTTRITVTQAEFQVTRKYR